MVKKLRRSNLSVDAYTFVRDLLISGTRYKPGEKISVEELSRELGVSRTPLWGAINRLQAEGVVETVPRQGVYLIEYNPDRVLEIYHTREALEVLAARLAAEHVSDRQIAALEASANAQRQRLAANDFPGYFALALEFHAQIARASRNRTLERLITSILAQIHAMGVKHNVVPTHMLQFCDDHDCLLEALRQHDPVRAEQEARSHMKGMLENIRRSLRPEPPPESPDKSISPPP